MTDAADRSWAMIRVTASPPARCLQCDEPMAMPLVCSMCRTIYPAANEYDHFARFSLPRSLQIDEKDLERRYLMLSRGLHPDQFAVRGAEERELAEQLSAHVNDAFAVLKDRFRRAEYLLELEGGPLRVDEKRTPAGFLQEMLDANELVEDAKHRLDDAARASLDALRRDLARRRDTILDALGARFDALAPRGDLRRTAALSAIREQLNACAYLSGLAAQIREILTA